MVRRLRPSLLPPQAARRARRVPVEYLPTQEGGRMTTATAVAWQKDVDAALEQSRAIHRPALLDFSAAPA